MIVNYFLFILFSLTDLWLTKILVVDSQICIEANPIARFFLINFGLLGLCTFKICSMILILAIMLVVSSSSEISRLVLFAKKYLMTTANVLLFCVCVYELFLYLTEL
jgi:hypothetical protein